MRAAAAPWRGAPPLLALLALLAAAAAAPLPRQSSAPPRPTLVLYHMPNPGDDVALSNLRHFLAAAAGSGAGAAAGAPARGAPLPGAGAGEVDVVVLVPPPAPGNASAGGPWPRLPPLPPAAPGGASMRYVRLPAAAAGCAAGWGAHGWYLRRADPGAATRYAAFALASSDMAGPFLPKYAQVGGVGGWGRRQAATAGMNSLAPGAQAGPGP
jgi:hypothetical protein